MELANKLFKGDRTIWVIYMFLCLVSIVEVYSATSTLAYKAVYFWSPIMRHAWFLFIGFMAVLALHNIPSRYFSAAIIILPCAIILLIVTLCAGVSKNDALRWISFMGASFQPSEFAKFGSIVFVAFMLSKQERFTPDRTFWIILSGVGLACALILPENFSTAFLLGAVCYLMMIIGQAPAKKLVWLLVILLLLGGLAFAVVRYMPADVAGKYLPDRMVTWNERIKDFGKDRDESKYVLNDDNLQVNHAKIAIARGGIIGNLPGRSVQRDFLPVAFSDFIYAIIIEEMGLVIGGGGVLALYVILLFRVAVIARRCKKLFPKYLALGCGLQIAIQAFLNMAVAVNLIPVTGQPLPLISQGGTSIVFTCMCFGIILSVSRFSAGMGNEDGETGNGEEEETAAAAVEMNGDGRAEEEDGNGNGDNLS